MQDFTKQFKDTINFDAFNAYRVDLDILLAQSGDTVLVNKDDKSFVINLRDLSQVASYMGAPYPRACEYLMDSLADISNTEYNSPDYINVIGLRKEATSLGSSDVRKRLWCTTYKRGTDVTTWRDTNPILNVFNESIYGPQRDLNAVPENRPMADPTKAQAPSIPTQLPDPPQEVDVEMPH